MPIVFDLVNKTFDQMAFTVLVGIILTRGTTIGPRRNDRFRALISNALQKIIDIIGAICNQMVIVKTVGQVKRLGDVVALSRRQPEPQRIAQRIDTDMNFSGKAPPTASQGLVGLSSFDFRRSRGTRMRTYNRAIDDQVLQIC